MMYDEEGEVGEIRCHVCERDIGDGDCEHLLAMIDWTQGYCSCGVGCDAIDEYRTQIGNALLPLVQAGVTPTWNQWEIDDLWEALRFVEFKEPKEVGGCPAEVFKLIFAAWEAAGATEHQGQLIDSGECRVRLFFAENPAETCKTATRILDEWLQDYRPSEKKPKNHAAGINNR